MLTGQAGVSRRRSKINRRKDSLREMLKSLRCNPCKDCGKEFPHWVMEFDHLDSKDKTGVITKLINRKSSRGKVLAEIAKCELVCANCHKDREFQRGRVEYQHFKSDETKSACVSCQEDYPPWIMVAKHKACHNCHKTKVKTGSYESCNRRQQKLQGPASSN